MTIREQYNDLYFFCTSTFLLRSLLSKSKRKKEKLTKTDRTMTVCRHQPNIFLKKKKKILLMETPRHFLTSN